MRIVLLGDSHLARIQRQLPRIGENVLNAAQGGATVRHLEAQAEGVRLTASDLVVVSVGTNDAAPWNAVPVADFQRTLSRFVGSRQAGAWVIMTPPGVDESRLGAGDRTNAVVAHYRDAATAVADSRTARLLDTRSLLTPLGADAFAKDGLHLSGLAYRLLLPALAQCGRTC
ncbi:SGNH/GDSL hydrolase family protein [Nocardioides sediminis]|uniref:SGNH/GDSL hydrolase family protein n=1 Tax=Nocardioides sediminis TaxID=433648 RepID=UPI000D3280E6|nr:GDSL-type esterase/lipase family protein [Nocardioides sediminis]